MTKLNTSPYDVYVGSFLDPLLCQLLLVLFEQPSAVEQRDPLLCSRGKLGRPLPHLGHGEVTQLLLGQRLAAARTVHGVDQIGHGGEEDKGDGEGLGQGVYVNKCVRNPPAKADKAIFLVLSADFVGLPDYFDFFFARQ